MQLALTLMLAHGAALMVRSYWTLRTMETGFSTEDVLTIRLDVSGPRYSQPERVGALFDELVRRVQSLPGVLQAAAINRLPLEGGRNDTLTIEGRDPRLGRGPLTETRVITPGYFEAMGIRLISGRMLTELDGSPDSSPTAVINQTMARRCWPDENPIGKRFRYDEGHPWLTVVGVVADTRQRGIEWPARPEAYMIHGASPFQSGLRFLVVRAATDPMSLVASVRRELAGVDSDQPVTDIRTMDEVVDASIAERQFGTLLVGIFAFTALLLVVAAVYALMSFFVGQRTPEIGVRMAFGATRGSVLRLILSTALILTGFGAAIGLAGIAATTRLVRGLVYGISPGDPVTVAGGAVMLFVIALAGALVPAWRASRVDPAETLRSE
jgi:putative ABC transport system permease protein